MVITSETILYINPSVDVYKIGEDRLEFYFITTRQRVSLQVTPPVIRLVQALNEEQPLEQVCRCVGIAWHSEQVHSFLEYLYRKKILLDAAEQRAEQTLLSEEDRDRYDRQLHYFNSVMPGSAARFQAQLQETVVLIFGVGAVGSGIALQLAMAGVHHFILIDKDVVTADSLQRHYTFQVEDIGRPKVDALADYLRGLDDRIVCHSYCRIVDYDTRLDEWLEQADLVVNTLDEPYIGYTSLKIGRACYARHLPLYVGGGFDAHLMSTGELIVPDQTPCVDCYTDYFTEQLKEWKPQYNVEAISDQQLLNNQLEVGGLASMTLFSVSYAVIVILRYLATGEVLQSRGRGEALFSQMTIQYLDVPKNPHCHVCGNR